MKSKNKYFTIFYSLVFVFMAFLGFWMPKLGDDWNWWSGWGTSYFSSGTFLSYDGRYFGDFLIINIMHNYWLRAFVYGITIVSILYLIDKIMKKLLKVNYNYPLASMLMFLGLLLLPKDIFQQTLGWSAGFVNYVISVIFPLLILYLLVSAYNNKAFNISNITYVLFFLASIIAQFMAEHVTIFNIGILMVTLFMFKYFNTQANKLFRIGFLGSFIGGILMFTNKAYLKVFFHEDSYRSTSDFSRFWLTNYIDQRVHVSLGIFIFAVVCCSLYVIYLFRNNRIKVPAAGLSLLGLWIYPLLVFINNKYITSEKRTAFAIILFLAAVTFILLKQRNILRSLLDIYLLWGAIGLLIPFMVVKPFGPRCAFMSAVFLLTLLIIKSILFISALNINFHYLANIILVLAVILGVRFLFIAYDYHVTERTSEEFLAYQRKKDVDVYYFLDYKNTDYLWMASPVGNDSVTKTYMTRKGLNSKTVLLSYHDWMKVRKEYINNPKKMYHKLLKLKPIKKFY